MIAWWVCVILCFGSAWLGFFLAALCNARRDADVVAEGWRRGK